MQDCNITIGGHNERHERKTEVSLLQLLKNNLSYLFRAFRLPNDVLKVFLNKLFVRENLYERYECAQLNQAESIASWNLHICWAISCR